MNFGSNYAANNSGRREQRRAPRTPEEAISGMIAEAGQDFGNSAYKLGRHLGGHSSKEKSLVTEYATVKLQRWALECGRYADEIIRKYTK